MEEKLDGYDAQDIARMIRRRRPDWNHEAIMTRLKRASESGATLVQATAAAEKTWNNPKAKTPEALTWPEHWVFDAKSVTLTGTRLCIECTTKQPIQNMHNTGRGWECNTHQEDAA